MSGAAERSRVTSEDLSQEAEGLRRNAEDMRYTLRRLRQDWRQHTVLVEQYAREVRGVRREVAALPEVSESARAALFSATEAMGEASRVAQRVMQMTLRIKSELRARAREMQSFSPDELNNIPRKCKKNMRVHQLFN